MVSWIFTVLLLWMVPSLLGQGDIPASSLRLVTKGERTAPYLVAGRVEVLHNGRWGTICSKGFDRIDAQVLCQKLTGPSSSILRYGEVGSFGLQFDQAPSTAPVLLENLQCTAVDSVCQHSGFGNTDCSHDRDIAISCQAPGAIRLWNGSFSGPAGRLEVFISTTETLWFTICAQGGIDQSAADVACRQLGYERAYDYGSATSLGFQSVFAYTIKRFQCSSSDLLLNNCTIPTIATNTTACRIIQGLDQYVAVSCINPGTNLNNNHLSAAQISGIVFGILIIVCCACVIGQIVGAGLVSYRKGACRSSTGRPSSNRHAPQNNQLNSSLYSVGHYPSSSQQQSPADNRHIDKNLAVAVEPSAPPLEAAVTHAGEAPPAYHTVVQYKTVNLNTEDPNIRLSKDLAQFAEHPTSCTLTEPGAPPAYL